MWEGGVILLFKPKLFQTLTPKFYKEQFKKPLTTVRRVSAEQCTLGSCVRWWVCVDVDVLWNVWKWFMSLEQRTANVWQLIFVFLHKLKLIHHSSPISRPSKKWRRQKEWPRNSKERTVWHSARFIPVENTPADHCIWDWTFLVQYHG